ncbi:NUDIX domain-containing protein [Candidatus Micrarchaeota archaeon]|nr:NUDIX domain-containing protein [Candidatus Micrarchaeota archaeon]
MVSDKQLHIVIAQGLIERDGRYLVIKRAGHEIAYPGKWEFPGGKVEVGERILDSLKKEIKEETGLEMMDECISLLDDFEFTRPDGFHVIGLTFLCKWKNCEVKLSGDHTDFKWIRPEEAREFDSVPSVPTCIKKAASLCR